jgi:flagellar biosynthetic protein FliR
MNGIDFGFGALEGELWRVLFAMTRIGPALLAAPFFGAATVPMQLRVAVAGAVAIMVCAWTPLQAPAAMFSFAGMITIMGEVLVGLALGLVLQIAFAAPVMAAEIISGSMGLSMATAVDPATGEGSTALGQYFTVALSLIFLTLGGHLHWLSLVIDSYKAFPPGQTWLGADKIQLILGFTGEMFATAIAIALPVTFVLLVVQILTGVLSRSAPSLNLFALGLPASVLAGIAALIAAIPLITGQFIELSRVAVENSAGLLVR